MKQQDVLSYYTLYYYILDSITNSQVFFPLPSKFLVDQWWFEMDNA